MHFILLPLTLIVSSILERKNSMSCSHPIAFVSLISTSIWNIFFNIIYFTIWMIISQMVEARPTGVTLALTPKLLLRRAKGTTNGACGIKWSFWGGDVGFRSCCWPWERHWRHGGGKWEMRILMMIVLRHEGEIGWKDSWTLYISWENIKLSFFSFVGLALSMANLSSEIDLIEVWVFIIWKPADSFMRIIFKTGKSVSLGDFSTELRCWDMFFVQNDIFFLIWKQFCLRSSSCIFYHDVINLRYFISEEWFILRFKSYLLFHFLLGKRPAFYNTEGICFCGRVGGSTL